TKTNGEAFVSSCNSSRVKICFFISLQKPVKITFRAKIQQPMRTFKTNVQKNSLTIEINQAKGDCYEDKRKASQPKKGN
ncbi:hypothetical protein, partial [Vibrio cholerae]|uniref:hypothetical protein n=6 Tax=Vibrio cholerae TaxID=666 RepID=UPI001E5A52D4